MGFSNQPAPITNIPLEGAYVELIQQQQQQKLRKNGQRSRIDIFPRKRYE